MSIYASKELCTQSTQALQHIRLNIAISCRSFFAKEPLITELFTQYTKVIHK